MRRVVCCLLAFAAALCATCCMSPATPSPAPSPSAKPGESEQTPDSIAPSGRYVEPHGYWSLTYRMDTWRPDPNDEDVLQHASHACALVLAGWPMGMEGPEAELFEMREKQVPILLGEHIFHRSILAAKSDKASYAGEMAYYLSQGDVFAHIVLIVGKDIYGKPEELALCQQDAEAAVSTLSVE